MVRMTNKTRKGEMRLWVPVDQSKMKGSISEPGTYKPDPKTWRLATKRERLRYEVTRPRYSLLTGPALWLLICLSFVILDALTGVRL
jgi:hypothetical protein